jgi:hypothetical protein
MSYPNGSAISEWFGRSTAWRRLRLALLCAAAGAAAAGSALLFL